MSDTIVQAITYIVKTPGFRRGEPHFAGRHLAVEVVVDAYVNHGASVEEIEQSYEIAPAAIHAALAYYYDHKDEFEAMWQEMDRIEAEHAPSSEQQAAEMERLLAKMKVENPEKYERFMRAREERDAD